MSKIINLCIAYQNKLSLRGDFPVSLVCRLCFIVHTIPSDERNAHFPRKKPEPCENSYSIKCLSISKQLFMCVFI